MFRRSPTIFAAACVAAGLTCRGFAADPPTDAYGDPLPPGAVARLGSARTRHNATGLTWAPDGKTLASAGADGVVRVWDAEDGREVRHYKTATSISLNSVLYMPNGKSLAALGGDGAVHVWDLATAREVRTVSPGAVVGIGLPGRLALGPDDGAVTAVGFDNVCRVVDLSTGKTVRETTVVAAARPVLAIVSADGRRFATWTGQAGELLTVWDVAGGKELFHTTTGFKFVNALAFSGDGATLAALGAAEAQLVTWDVDAGKELRRYDGVSPSDLAVFSPNGKYLAARGLDRVIHLWGLASGKELRQFEAPPYRSVFASAMGAMVFSPNGKKLAACQGSTIRLWDVEAGQELFSSQGHAGPVDDLRFSADGRRLLSCGKDGAARLWDVAAARQVAVWNGPQTPTFWMAASPDAKTVIAASGSGLVRADLGEGKATDRVLVPPASGGVPTGLVVSPDGKSFAGSGADRLIHLWDMTTGKDVTHLSGDPSLINVVLAFAPDGKTMAASSQNAPVRVLDAVAGKELRQLDSVAAAAPPAPGAPPPIVPGQLRNVAHMSFSPDGRAVLCVTFSELSLWETVTGRDRMRIVRTNGNLTRAAMAPTGAVVAAGSTSGVVQVFDAATGDELTRLDAGQGAGITSLAFAPDGTTLAAGAADGQITIWDMKEWVERPMRVVDLKPEKLPLLWKDLIDGDGGRSYRAILTLAGAPKAAAPYLQERLAGVVGGDEKRIAHLIVDLNDDLFETRESAQKELDKMGDLALSALRKALESNPSAETRRRVQEILDKHKDVVAVTEEVRTFRAVEALERSAAPEALAALRALAKEAPNLVVKDEALAALERLARRSAAP
jgi:WD40 repeat protein